MEDRKDEDQGYRPLNLPKCDCFDFEADSDHAIQQCNAAATVGTVVSQALMEAAIEAGMCKEALPFVVETLVIQLLTMIAVHGTAIDCGTKEALWETERILEGMEARIKAQLEHAYAYTQKVGLTKEKVEAWRRSGGRGPILK